jgi:hypothetical protein
MRLKLKRAVQPEAGVRAETASPVVDLGQHAEDGARRAAQLNDDARWQFLLAEDTLNTARQTLNRVSTGQPLDYVVPAVPAPVIVTPAYRPSRSAIGFVALAALTAAVTAVIFALSPDVTAPSHAAATLVEVPSLDAPISSVTGGPPVQDLGASIYAARFAKVSAAEKQCLARAIYYEARGEGLDGQIAVAQVVLNRARSSKWADTICGVIQQGAVRGEKCQFSFACNSHISEPTGELWEQAQAFAEQAVTGHAWLRELMDATHYHTVNVAPVWRLNLTEIGPIGSHIFYRENDGLREAHGAKAITGVEELRSPAGAAARAKSATSNADKSAKPRAAAAKKSDDDWAVRMFRP